MTRHLTARRTAAALAATPLLIAALVGCGDDKGAENGADNGGGASTDAAAAAALSGLSTGDEVDPDEFVDIVTAGIEESTTAHVEMKVTLGDQIATDATGDLDYTSTPPSMEMSMEIPGAGDAEMVMVDGVLYMQMGEASGDKYWRIDPSDEDGIFAGMGLDKMLEQSDPLGTLDSMRSGIDTVTFEGTEDVDGRELDHYELSIDTQAMLESYGAGQRGMDAESLPKTITYDLWLDDANRFAQMELVYPVVDQEMSVEMTVEDWGKDVDIEAPPADEVTEMPDLGAMMG